jgi:hypothetical protein
MKNLPKEKRNQLVLVIMVTGMALSGLWFGLISYQEGNLRALTVRKQEAAQTRDRMEWAIKHASMVEADLAEASGKLAKLENDMASGDLYSWVINSVRQFKLPYKVEIPQYSQIDGPRDVSLLPSFPYKQAALTVGGTAFFYDFGRFLSDFENQFPYIRVLNLSLEPFAGVTSADREKLTFKMDIVVLVKPSTS